MYIPPGFNTVTPYFFVDGAQAFIEFLVAGLGGVEVSRSMRDDGLVANAMVRLGTSTVMVSDTTPAFPAMPASYYLYVEDAHAAMKRAIDHGATLVSEVGDRPYGDRQGGARDRHGNLWWISQRIVHAPYDD
jgi:PhnB protein